MSGPERPEISVREDNARALRSVFAHLIENASTSVTPTAEGSRIFVQDTVQILKADHTPVRAFANVWVNTYPKALYNVANFRLSLTFDQKPLENLASFSLLEGEIAKISSGIQKKNATDLFISPFLEVRKEFQGLGLGSSFYEVGTEMFTQIPSELFKPFGFTTITIESSDTSIGEWSTRQAKKLGFSPERLFGLIPVPNGMGRQVHSKKRRL